MNVLFVCSQNKLRSPTAAQVFAEFPGVETDSAGTHRGADVELCEEHILWAEVIFAMEPEHVRRIRMKFRKHLRDQRVICLDIPDDFGFMDPALISLLEKKITPFLRQAHR